MFKGILLIFLGNLAGITAASYLIKGFTVDPRSSVVILAALLTVLHLTVKPILKLLAWPIVVLTLGIGLILVNAAVLATLDFVSENLTIKGLEPLALGTLIVGGANLIVHLARAAPRKT